MCSDANRSHAEESSPSYTKRIHLIWPSNRATDFGLLLQQGFFVPCGTGVSVRDVVCGELGVESDYLDRRINTIFLNGKPVDDVDAAFIEAGSTLTLSASMPGLVGAVMRKGGFYAAMRCSITHRTAAAGPAGHEKTLLRLKLLNMTANELGPLFLQRGVLITGSELAAFFASRPDTFWKAWEQGSVDDEEVGPDEFRNTDWGAVSGMVHFVVNRGAEHLEVLGDEGPSPGASSL
ncbi:MAG: hypothetical protein V2B18_16730 [Pseudomonadota bacterium]